MNDSREQFYKRAAAEYAESYGAELRRELEELEQSGAVYVTPGLDRRVMNAVGREKRVRRGRWIGLLAAGIALAVIVPGVLRQRELGIAGSGSSAQAAPEAAAQQAEPELELDEAAPEPDQDAGGIAESRASSLEPIPLSFELPGNFSVAAFEQDYGKSVYTLANTELDDVVLTLEYSGPEASFDGFVEIGIGDNTAYGRSTPDYSLLMFEKRDIVYTLSCRYDINTLVGLSKKILADM